MASAEPEATLDNLVPKKSSTSVVWKYFGFRTTDVQQKQVLCTTCRGKVATSRGNTTNLYQHLKKHHRQLYDECTVRNEVLSPVAQSNVKQTSVLESFAAVTPYEKGSRRHREITNSIMHYLAKDMVSINTVSNEGFKKLIRTLDKRYAIPSRTYFSHVAIPEMYTECRNKLETELKNEYYATTTDLWSSRTTEPYLSLTVHFINYDFELKSHCLQTVYFPADHTGENIAHGLRESLSNWGLKEEDQTCITTDNGSNVVKAVELNHWTRLQCFGHRLHLAIGKCVSLSPSLSLTPLSFIIIVITFSI